MKGEALWVWLRRFHFGPCLVLISVCAVAVTSGPSRAQQQLPSSLSQQLLESVNNRNSGQPSTSMSGVPQQPVILTPDDNGPARLPVSRLEQIMSSRANVKLTQFGYSDLGSGHAVSVSQSGAVQDGYILGNGDQLTISLRGQENSEYRITVDRNGQVILPKLKPILAAGRTLADFRADLVHAVHSAYVSTEAFVSIGQIRQFAVLVSGEVQNPGQRSVTGLSSVVDAILLSGGVKKTGSLRNVKLVRNGVERTIDLYGILTQSGAARIVNLTEGDRIIVPPLGRTVAVAGWVRRPGIYELAAGSSAIAVSSLLRLSGGLEVSGKYRMSVLHVERDGRLALLPLVGESGLVRDGELLTVQPGSQEITSRATLSGSTPLAGGYSVRTGGARLSSVINAPGALGSHPYALFGLIVRRDPATQIRTLVPFAPVAVLQGHEDLPLQSGDLVRVFTTNEFRLIAAVLKAFELAHEHSAEALRDPLDNPQAVREIANDERQEIATLSTKTLGEGGVLSDRLPTNELPPYGLTSAQQTYILGVQGTSNPIQQQSVPVSGQFSAYPAPESGGAYPRNFYPPSYPYPSPVGGVNAQAATGALRSGNQMESNGGPALSADAGFPPPANFQEQNVPEGEIASNTEVQTFGQLSRQLDVDALVLAHFLSDQSAVIGGAVQGAGNYLVGPGVTLQDLVAAVGGTQRWTDKNHVEIVSTAVLPDTEKSETQRQLISLNDPSSAAYQVKPHDEIRFNQIYVSVGAGTVTIQGQVRDTGTFNIERGERLSELLLRAGGLTDQAYPIGTVFLRKSVAANERVGYRRAADEVENVLLAGMTRVGNEKIAPEAFASLQGFVSELRNAQAVGRISIVADPAVLVSHPDRDPILEPGDMIYIPQRPSTVTVLGQVMQGGSFLFDPHASAEDYIDLAGGYAQFADKSLAFVIYPDGTSHRVGSSWLSFDNPSIPPGSTIVVPRDLQPIDLRQTILDVTGILGQLAVSAASLAVISRNN